MDFEIQNEGSIFLLRPLTPEAQNWIDENISDDAQWFGSAVAVEHRYIFDIIDGIQDAGLTIRK